MTQKNLATTSRFLAWNTQCKYRRRLADRDHGERENPLNCDKSDQPRSTARPKRLRARFLLAASLLNGL
jgi:hypothetical protein